MVNNPIRWFKTRYMTKHYPFQNQPIWKRPFQDIYLLWYNWKWKRKMKKKFIGYTQEYDIQHHDDSARNKDGTPYIGYSGGAGEKEKRT